METSDSVFVDSNYFIALANPEDSQYEKARKVTEELKKNDNTLVISNLIFAEVVTVVSQRRGRGSAVVTGEFLNSDPSARVVHVSPAFQTESWRLFKEIKNKDISFVDASIIATMRAEGIQTLLTFDVTHFKPLAKEYRLKLFKS